MFVFFCFPGLVHSTYILFLPLLHELISVPRLIVWTTSSFFVPHTKQIFFPPQVSTETVRPGERIQAFGAKGFGIVWLDKRSFWLVNGCLEYHRPIITNFCPPKWLKESLHSKLVPILLIISVGNTAVDKEDSKHVPSLLFFAPGANWHWMGHGHAFPRIFASGRRHVRVFPALILSCFPAWQEFTMWLLFGYWNNLKMIRSLQRKNIKNAESS